MGLNFLKISWRLMRRYKSYSFINIIGLAVGLASCILILLWVQDEWRFDHFHQHLNSLYRVVNESHKTSQVLHQAVTPAPLAAVLKADFPEIQRTTRYAYGGELFRVGELCVDEKNIGYADPDFLRMFTFPLIAGDPATALNDPNSIILSRELAQKLFGTTEVLGKTIQIKKKYDLKVTGVLTGVPTNSSFQFNCLMPFEFLGKNEDLTFWGAHRYYSFVELVAGSDARAVSKKISGVLTAHEPESKSQLYLQPFKEMHLHSKLNYDIFGKGDIKYVWIFSSLAIFILGIACINFVNLTTARSSNRAKEVGIRRTIGANRQHLIRQFIGESLIFTLIALALAVVLVELVLPGFNLLAGKELSLDYSATSLWLGFLILLLITGVLAGGYPAVLLSGFQPTRILKSQRGVAANSSRSSGRKVLVIFQFTLTIVFLISTFVISDQLEFLRHKNLGFDKEHVVYVPIRGNILRNLPAFKNELQNHPTIESVTASFQLPVRIGSSPGDYEWEGQQPGETIQMSTALVNYDYFETFRMQMAQGRSFSREFASDDSAAYIVNEAAVKAMGMTEPLGKRFAFWNLPGRIVGVVKDFHAQSLHKPINPTVFKIDHYWLFYVYARIEAGKIPEGIAALERTWKKFNPEYPFEYHFLDEEIDRQYRAEQQAGTILRYATFLAIFIACLGLFGLASFLAVQQTKEIGIRKVLGASVAGVVLLFSRRLVSGVLVANLLAWPLAWLALRQWLQNFAYHIQLSWEIFFLAGGSALAIALLTVSYQAVKTALANPVEALKYE